MNNMQAFPGNMYKCTWMCPDICRENLSNSSHTQKMEWLFQLLLWWKLIFSAKTYNFQLCILYKELRLTEQRRTSKIPHELYTCEDEQNLNLKFFKPKNFFLGHYKTFARVLLSVFLRIESS